MIERKKKVCKNEYKLHKLMYSLYSFIPKCINYNEITCELTMQNIDSLNISDMYGEKFTDIPESIRDEVREIIKNLYEDGFCYPDITGYNFIEDNNGKIWLIDFEHCFCKGSYKILTNNEKQYISFIEGFISGEIQSWNPGFL
jgi:RIO-like serine/threonine protein kinase